MLGNGVLGGVVRNLSRKLTDFRKYMSAIALESAAFPLKGSFLILFLLIRRNDVNFVVPKVLGLSDNK